MRTSPAVFSGKVEAQPLLTRFAVARTGKQELPGFYDEARQIWAIDTPTGPEPIVRSEELRNVSELSTKTAIAPEQDDASFGSVVELVTKTSSQTEKDDVSPRDPFLLELVTMTKVGGERPDIS